MRSPKRLPPEQVEPYVWKAPPYPTDPAQKPEQMEWAAIFGNTHPVEIEIGFGKGLFLVEATGAHPEINYFGIEIERKHVMYTATRLAKRERANVRVTQADARALLTHRVATESVDGIHVYFPDPWWKKRHAKRRLFSDDFVQSCERVLKQNGLFHIATDVGDYFEVMQELMAQHPIFAQLPAPEEKEPEHDLDYLTNFERKARQQGKPIYRALYQKQPIDI